MTGDEASRPRTIEEWVVDGHGATPDQFDVPDSSEIEVYSRLKIAEIAKSFEIAELDQVILLWRTLRWAGLRYHALKEAFEGRILVGEQIEELGKLQRAADALSDQIRDLLSDAGRAGSIAPALLQIDASIASSSVAFLGQHSDDQSTYDALSDWTKEFEPKTAASYMKRELSAGRRDELFPQIANVPPDFYSVVFKDCAEAGHIPRISSAIERAHHYSAYISFLCSVAKGQKAEAKGGRPSKPHAVYWCNAIARYWTISLGRHDGIDKSGRVGGSRFEHFTQTCFDLLDSDEWLSARSYLSKRRTGRKPE